MINPTDIFFGIIAIFAVLVVGAIIMSWKFILWTVAIVFGLIALALTFFLIVYGLMIYRTLRDYFTITLRPGTEKAAITAKKTLQNVKGWTEKHRARGAASSISPPDQRTPDFSEQDMGLGTTWNIGYTLIRTRKARYLDSRIHCSYIPENGLSRSADSIRITISEAGLVMLDLNTRFLDFEKVSLLRLTSRAGSVYRDSDHLWEHLEPRLDRMFEKLEDEAEAEAQKKRETVDFLDVSDA